MQGIRKALQGKIGGQAEAGKWVKSETGEVVTLENLDRMLQDATEEFTDPSLFVQDGISTVFGRGRFFFQAFRPCCWSLLFRRGVFAFASG